MLKKIWNKIQERINKNLFSNAARKIRSTPPLSVNKQGDVIIVSQVYHDAVDMTLLALKSFMKNLGRGSIELIDDGSLTNDDKLVLQMHLPNVKIIHINTIETGDCPQGGTWERLIWILNRSKNAYVIQVDTDTLTVGALPEIDACIRGNTAFTIGGPMWLVSVDTEYMNYITNSWSSTHIQTKAESHLADCKNTIIKNYFRGCSAFTGFPKGGVSFEVLEKFSIEMESYVGKERWREWGTEQFSSNVMISLSNKPQILPWPKYQNFGQPFCDLKNTQGVVSVFHFIGTFRYKNRIYERLARNFIQKL